MRRIQVRVGEDQGGVHREVPVLGALSFVVACTDASGPDPHASLRPGTPTPVVQGNVPPPPTVTAIEITVSSPVSFTAVFTGVYFANPSIESVAAAAEVGDPTLVTAAWLRLDNKQLTDQKSSGHGTLFFSDGVVTHTVVIGAVTWDFANPDCNAAFEVCAIIRFEATVDGEEGHSGRVEAFGCELRTDEGGNSVLFCPIGS